MGLFDHPGNLGPTRGTLFTVHHADWPAYPQGDDFRTPLLQLTAFPAGTEFKVVDHIDKSALFIACVPGAKVDHPFSTSNFHIAVWYEDLISLDRQGFATGIRRATERQWQEDRWQQLRSSVPDGATIGYRVEDGTFVRYEPDFDSYEDDLHYGDFVICSDDLVSVTPSGREFILHELATSKQEIMTAVGQRVADLFDHQYYDTCIREACVALEHDIRLRTRSEKYGDQLIDLFVAQTLSDKRYLESYVRTYRQELRAVFKFIRNKFMHNLSSADAAATLAILFRIASARTLLDVPTPPRERAHERQP